MFIVHFIMVKQSGNNHRNERLMRLGDAMTILVVSDKMLLLNS